MEVMMKKTLAGLITVFILAYYFHPHLIAKTLPSQLTKPHIQHGINYTSVENIAEYFVSEKLDGVRGYWDGDKLFTRQGKPINSPMWFTKNWPKHPVDGELWIERNQFQPLLSCVSKKKTEIQPAKSCWQNVRFMMFDLPQHGGVFAERVDKMRQLLKEIKSPYFAMINQEKFEDLEAVEVKLSAVMLIKGEGLMLHHDTAHYKSGRNKQLLKFKRHQDAEATVIGYTHGKGKYEGLLGAVKVQTPEGVEFKIGSGFSDKQRVNPPPIGSIITYKYNGLTQAGIPRFARFWRIRASK